MATAQEVPMETSSVSPTCVYHGKQWRAPYQFIINALRKVVIPQKDVPKLSKVVCTCGNRNEDIRPEDFQAISAYFTAELANPESVFVKAKTDPALLNKADVEKVIAYFRSLLVENSPGGKSPPKKSRTENTPADLAGRFRLLNIIKGFLTKDSSFLKDAIKGLSKAKKPPAEEEKMLLEKKITLQLPLKMIGHLVGKKGHRLKDIQDLFNCQITLHCPSGHTGYLKKQLEENANADIEVIECTIKGETAEDVRLTDESMVDLVESVKKEREQAAKSTEEHLAQRVAKRREQYGDDDGDDLDDDFDLNSDDDSDGGAGDTGATGGNVGHPTQCTEH